MDFKPSSPYFWYLCTKTCNQPTSNEMWFLVITTPLVMKYLHMVGYWSQSDFLSFWVKKTFSIFLNKKNKNLSSNKGTPCLWPVLKASRWICSPFMNQRHQNMSMLTLQLAVNDFKLVFCMFIQDELIANFVWFLKIGVPLIKHPLKADMNSEKVGKRAGYWQVQCL